MNLVGKTLRGKINGCILKVEKLKKEYHNKDTGTAEGEYYIIRDLVSGGSFCHSRGWFENGIMQNMEIVDN